MRRLLGGCSVLVVLLFACGEPVETPPAPAPEVPPTYHRDIAPLVQEKCGSCHTQGGIAPFPLQTYAQVFESRWAVQGGGEGAHT